MITSTPPSLESYYDYQDLLSQGKDYILEVNYLDKLIRQYSRPEVSLLDVGCGTGSHAFLLAERGYSVYGVDYNECVIEVARKRLMSSNDTFDSRVSFHQQDARKLKLDQQFDVVTAMYNVIGYMTSNCDVSLMLSSIRRHLKTNGIFICDFWYGSSFVASPPRIRLRKGKSGGQSYVHIAEPTQVHECDRVDVDYTLLLHNKKTTEAKEFHEKSSYRYFFLPEIEMFLNFAGLELLAIQGFMTDKVPSLDTRELCLVARKKD